MLNVFIYKIAFYSECEQNECAGWNNCLIKMCCKDESLNFLMQSYNTINKEKNTNPLIDQNIECKHLNVSGGNGFPFWVFQKIKKQKYSPAKCLVNIWKYQFKWNMNSLQTGFHHVRVDLSGDLIKWILWNIWCFKYFFKVIKFFEK